MALVIQTYEIVNELMKQVVGQDSVFKTTISESGDVTVTTEPLDFTGLVSVGRDWLVNGGNENVMYNALYDIIGDYIIQDRILPRINDFMITENPMYGQAVEKVYYEPIEARDNPAYKDTYNSETDDPFQITMVKIAVKIFSRFTTWEVPFTINPRETIMSAFTSDSTMTRFISGIWQCAENSMTAKLDACANMARIAWIGHKLLYAKSEDAEGVHVVHLLTEYKEWEGAPATASSLTTQSARQDTDFLAWASQRMSIIYHQMSPMNQVFNTQQYKRFTPDSDKIFVMLANFASDLEFRLYSSTFHDTYMKLPTFHELPYWQGLGQSGDWDDISSINATIEDLTSDNMTATAPVQQSNIVAVIADRDAMGTTIYNRHTTSHYNGHAEYTNYWMKANIGMFADMSEQGVVFCLD